jgi:uncharacterized protein YukE
VLTLAESTPSDDDGTFPLTGIQLKQDDYKSLHEQLTSLIALLDTRVDSLIARHERDFLAAYAQQMQRVGKELEVLQARLDEKEYNTSLEGTV